MKKLILHLIFGILMINHAFAQLDITQDGDDIVLKNNADTSIEVFISDSSQNNILLIPGQSMKVSLNEFLTKKSLKEVKIASLYTFAAYLADAKLSIIRMREDIGKRRSNKRASLEWKSMEELLNNNEGNDAGKLDKFLESIGVNLNQRQTNQTKYESLVQIIEEQLIPKTNMQSFLVDDTEAFEIKEKESQMALARSYIFDFLNIEIDTDDRSEISFLVDHFNRVKSFKRNYDIKTVKEYGSLKELDFKVFQDFGGAFQLNLVASALAENIGEDNEDLIYNLNPEIGIRTGRFRIGKNTMIENNLNIGYSYYVADKFDERIVINDVVNNINEVYDKFHMATLGLDVILKGGVKKPSLIGIGAEGGATYIFSDTYNIMPNLELIPETNTDLGYYFGGFVMVGDRFNVKLGFRRYVLWYTPQDVNRNYLNTGLLRFSLSYRF